MYCVHLALSTSRFLCGSLYAPYINCQSFIHSKWWLDEWLVAQGVWVGGYIKYPALGRYVGKQSARTKSQAQYWRGFHSSVRNELCVSESPFSEKFRTVSLQPPSVIAGTNICTHVKNPKHWQSYTIVWTYENTAHSLLAGMGSAAPVAAVALPRYSNRNFWQGIKTH